MSSGAMLALECSTISGSAAVGNADGLLAEVTSHVRSRHSETLLPSADHALRLAGVDRSSLSGLVVGAGPGSFTGLRIAAATAKGMVHALDVPLFAYSSLLAAAAPLLATGQTVAALFDARGRDVFAACYRWDGELQILLPPSATTLEDVLGEMETFGVNAVVGDAVLKHRDEISNSLSAAVAPRHFAFPAASSLLWLATEIPEAGRVANPATWEPDYLRASGAERIRAAAERSGESK